MLLRSDIAIPHSRDSDYSGIEGSEVFELIQKVEVLEYHKDSRREVDRDEEIRQDRLQLRGDFTLTSVDEDCEKLGGSLKAIQSAESQPTQADLTPAAPWNENRRDDHQEKLDYIVTVYEELAAINRYV